MEATICCSKLSQPPINLVVFQNELGPNKVKLVGPIFDTESGDFKYLEGTIRLNSIRGDTDETLLTMGTTRITLKILYSVQRRKTPNSSTSTLFNRHKDLFDGDTMKKSFLNLLFLNPAATGEDKPV